MKLIERVNRKIGSILRKKYGALTVTRPYVIRVNEHKELKEKLQLLQVALVLLVELVQLDLLQKEQKCISADHILAALNLLLTK